MTPTVRLSGTSVPILDPVCVGADAAQVEFASTSREVPTAGWSTRAGPVARHW